MIPEILKEKLEKLRALPHYLRSGDETDLVTLATALSIEEARANQLQREIYILEDQLAQEAPR